MADPLERTAAGIELALRAGGIELETYRRPGFLGGTGVRQVRDVELNGTPVDVPDLEDLEELD